MNTNKQIIVRVYRNGSEQRIYVQPSNSQPDDSYTPYNAESAAVFNFGGVRIDTHWDGRGTHVACQGADNAVFINSELLSFADEQEIAAVITLRNKIDGDRATYDVSEVLYLSDTEILRTDDEYRPSAVQISTEYNRALDDLLESTATAETSDY